MDHDIGWAIAQMRKQERVTRAGWNGPGQYLMLESPDGACGITVPYVAIRTVQGDLVPWLASQTDLLATDWRVAD